MQNDIPRKIDILFRTFTRPDGKEYTYGEVALGTSGAISSSYLCKLRRGQNFSPGFNKLESLAGFFGVPVGYFFKELTPKDEDELRLIAALREPDVREIAERALALDREGQETVLHLTGVISRLQGGKER